MDNVNFYNNDIAEIVDLNRLSSFPQAYQETFLEALTVGRRTVSINGVTPTVLAVVAPNITIRIPAQYFAVEGRIGFIPQTDVVVAHPLPATSYDFYIYLMLRLDEDSDTRTNVNPVTFVQTPTARVIAQLEVVEHTILDVVAGGVQPTPAIGVGVPGPGSERLGFVMRASFTWDGTATTPGIVDNVADNVHFGSAGIIPHGLTHVTTDPIPYPTNSERGMGPPRTLPYWKNSISRVEAAAGSPITSTLIGSNGPAGDTNYNVYNPATARGFELDFDFDSGSFQLVGTTFTPRFAAPPNGTAGSAPTFARSDHGHMNLFSPHGIWKKHNDPFFTGSGETSTSFEPTPAVATAVTTFGGGYADQIGFLQVTIKRIPNPNLRSTLQIVGGGGMTRQVALTNSGGANIERIQSQLVPILLNGSGTVTIQQLDGPSEYKIGLVGTFGQGT